MNKKTGFSVTFSVEMKQHCNSMHVLKLIKKYFSDKGSISFSNKNKSVMRFKISNLNDIVNLVIPLPYPPPLPPLTPKGTGVKG